MPAGSVPRVARLMALAIGRELAMLKQMTIRELREKYEAVFGEPTRAGNRDFLFKRIAWRIQSLAEGDLSERARRLPRSRRSRADSNCVICAPFSNAEI